MRRSAFMASLGEGSGEVEAYGNDGAEFQQGDPGGEDEVCGACSDPAWGCLPFGQCQPDDNGCGDQRGDSPGDPRQEHQIPGHPVEAEAPELEGCAGVCFNCPSKTVGAQMLSGGGDIAEAADETSTAVTWDGGVVPGMIETTDRWF